MGNSYEHYSAKAEAIAAHWASRVDGVSFIELRRQILDLLYEETAALEQAAAPALEVVPDWATLPDWVLWWAVRPDGRVVISDEDKPEIWDGNWIAKYGLRGVVDGGNLPVRVDLPLGIDWRQTLQARPASTQGVPGGQEETP